MGRRRAQAAITLTAALPGALYLYQGEEMGLEEFLDMPAEAREDPLFIRTKGKELGSRRLPRAAAVDDRPDDQLRILTGHRASRGCRNRRTGASIRSSARPPIPIRCWPGTERCWRTGRC